MATIDLGNAVNVGSDGARRDARLRAQRWAQRLMARARWTGGGDWVVLDTETTGLDGLAEVVQIGVLSPAGQTLLDTLVRPTRRIPPDATAIHGITNRQVAGAPAYPQVHPHLATALQGKLVIAYNAEFDARLLRQTAMLHRVPAVTAMWQCAMQRYAEYAGRWSDRHGHFMWQPLPREGRSRFAKHQALDDCRATLDLIRRMALGTL